MSEKKIKLLIVDDEKDICEFEKNYFDKCGLKAYAARNGSKAVALAKKEKPDIAIIDIYIGKESGLDILKKILKISKQCKCIAVTWDKEKAIEAKKIGAVDFVIKPAELSVLEKTIDKIIKKIKK